jgi:hypothetical protein
VKVATQKFAPKMTEADLEPRSSEEFLLLLSIVNAEAIAEGRPPIAAETIREWIED